MSDVFGFLLGVVIVGIIALLVYEDAKNRNLVNNSWGLKTPGSWAIAVFFFAIIFLSGYLITRGPTREELSVFLLKNCPKCGAPIMDGGKYCVNCGEKLYS